MSAGRLRAPFRQRHLERRRTYSNVTGNITGTARVTTTGVNATLLVTALPTPALTKAFAPASIPSAEPRRSPSTLANGPAAPPQSGTNFTDTLPANVVVAAAPALASTCPSGTGIITAAAGSGTITVTGATMSAGPGYVQPFRSHVTSNVAGNYNNATGKHHRHGARHYHRRQCDLGGLRACRR
jgi:hypothetical protein